MIAAPSGDASLRIGRFALALPPSAVHTRMQSIYRVQVTTWSGAPAATSAEWLQLYGVAEGHSPPEQRESSVVRRFELAGRHQAYWFRSIAGDTALVTLRALIAFADHAVFLERSCERADMAKVERLLTLMADAYVPHRLDGFAVGDGSLVSPLGDNESVDLTAVRGDGVELDFSTITTAHPMPEPPSIPPDVHRIVRADRPRMAAGLAGHETVSLYSGERPMLHASWRFPGEVRSAMAPTVLLLVTAPLSVVDAAEAVFNQLLDTLRRVSPASSLNP